MDSYLSRVTLRPHEIQFYEFYIHGRDLGDVCSMSERKNVSRKCSVVQFVRGPDSVNENMRTLKQLSIFSNYCQFAVAMFHETINSMSVESSI